MLPEGMVHALKEAWRVARVTVLDIRPTPDAPQVWVRDRSGREDLCGGLYWKGGQVHAHRAADEAYRQVAAAGLFEEIAERHFEWVDPYETPQELIEDIAEEWENWGLDEDVSLRMIQVLERAGRGAVPFVRQGVRARVLRKIWRPALV